MKQLKARKTAPRNCLLYATRKPSVQVHLKFVVSVNESFHAFATAVAYAFVVSVKKFRKLIIGRKVFVNEL